MVFWEFWGALTKWYVLQAPPFNWSSFTFLCFYILAFSVLLLYYNGVSETLELKKRLPEVVVTVVFPGTWEIRALKPVSGKVSFAGLPTQDLETFSCPLNWSPCRTFLAICRGVLAGTMAPSRILRALGTLHQSYLSKGGFRRSPFDHLKKPCPEWGTGLWL